MIDKIVEDQCTGCNMCADVCPQNAIYYENNEQGFSIPKVDYRKCVKCGICIKKCPGLIQNIYKKDIPKVYAAWTKDDEIRLKSTSGGIYYMIAKKFIQSGGYIVGSVYEKDYKSAHHIIGNTMEDLNKIMGSKYFQSNAEKIYNQVKQLLEKDKKVLFCGTPCQSVALQSFLNKEYKNLFIIDFICRGVNSPLAFKKHMEELEEEHNSKIKLVHLKNKKTGWQSLATYVEFENGDTCHQDKTTSPWIKGFIRESLYMRSSCYNCKYRTFPRVSDITIGDFWGISGMEAEDMFKGISCVMINSLKGQEIFDSIKPDIICQRKNFDELLDGNPALKYSPKKHINYNKFFELLKTEKFSDAINKCIENTNQKGFIEKIMRKISAIFRKIKFVLHIDTFKFIKYNFFSKNVVRDKNVYLIPYRGTILDLDKTARIYIKGKDIKLCHNKLKKSKAEMHLRMGKNAKWYSNNGALIFFNTYLNVRENAVLNTGFFSINSGSVITASKRINIGEDVMMGGNITIYDSDFHQVFDKEMKPRNYSKEVNIGDHVWLTSNVTVLKGVTIGRDSLVTAQTLIRKDFPENSFIAGGATGKVVSKCYGWSRKGVRNEEE